MSDFVTSLALVIASQVPLLLKLWLDYRSKLDIYKSDMHKRQTDAYIRLTHRLNRLHRDLHIVVEFAPYPPPKPVDQDSTYRIAHDNAGEAYMALHKLSLRDEAILPAAVVVAVGGYLRGSVQIMGGDIRRGLPSEKELEELWGQQQITYNLLKNDLRNRLGVEKLGAQVLDMIAQGKERTFLVHRYDQST